MADNILILGNGFDLAMGRKTSYEDFLRFSNAVHLLFSYVIRDIELSDSNLINIVEKKLSHFILELDELVLAETDDDFCDEQESYRNLSDSKKHGLLSEKLSSKLLSFRDDLNTFLKYNDFSNGAFQREILNEIKEWNTKQTKCLDFDIPTIFGLLSQSCEKGAVWLSKIHDNLFINYISKNKQHLGKNWSSIELVISDIAEAIREIKLNTESLSRIFSAEDCVELESIKNSFRFKENYMAYQFVCDSIYTMKIGYHSATPMRLIDDFNENVIGALEQITEYLEFYLSYLDKLDFEKDSLVINNKSILSSVPNIKSAKVITFNYTDTANKLLGIPKDNTHFIHGKINFLREENTINTMVFGIEDKESDLESINSDLIPYQKFYQRAVKETGNYYERFFELTRDGLDPIPKNIVVFGHSVDPLDKEIFLKCFNLAKKSGNKYKFIFSYRDNWAKRSIIKNLAIILGKQKLISLTAEQKIAFVKSDDKVRMQKELFE